MARLARRAARCPSGEAARYYSRTARRGVGVPAVPTRARRSRCDQRLRDRFGPGPARPTGCVLLPARDGWRTAVVRPLYGTGPARLRNTPRATPLIDRDRVYLLGDFGHLHAVELSTGKALWKKNIRTEFKAADRLVWGVCSSPLLVDGKLSSIPVARCEPRGSRSRERTGDLADRRTSRSLLFLRGTGPVRRSNWLVTIMTPWGVGTPAQGRGCGKCGPKPTGTSTCPPPCSLATGSLSTPRITAAACSSSTRTASQPLPHWLSTRT